MFRALDRKMKAILFSVVLVYVILSSLIVYSTIEKRSTEMQRQLSLQYTGQEHRNAQLFMKWLEESTSLVTNNLAVQNSLQIPEFDNSVLPVLDGMISSNPYIWDMVIYGMNGIVYTSSNVSDARSLQEVEAMPEYANFLHSSFMKEWRVQSPGSLVYRNLDPRSRLQYVAKMADKKEETIGLLVMTADLQKLNSFYHADDPEFYGTREMHILTRDHGLVNTNGQEVQDNALWRELESSNPNQETSVVETKDGIVLLYRLFHSEDRIAISISGEPVKNELESLKYILFAVGGLIVLVFILLIRWISDSILDPLKSLYKKMRHPHER